MHRLPRPAPARPRRALLGSSLAVLTLAGCSAATVAPPAGATEPARDAPGGTHAIAVSVDSIDEAVGTVRVALYASADGYAADEPVAVAAAPATTDPVNLALGRFPAGDYAVMLYHDRNGNETLDRNLLGIPREPWTGSMHRAVLGAPDWDDVRFALEGADLALELSL